MKFLTVFISALALAQVACVPLTATLKAADYQPEVDNGQIVSGITLDELESILGAAGEPIPSAAGLFVFRYEETEAWAGRKWLYWLVELPTMGAIAPLTLPIEVAVEQNAQRWGTALFDPQGRLVFFRSSKKPIDLVADSELRTHSFKRNIPLENMRRSLNVMGWEDSPHHPNNRLRAMQGQEGEDE